MNNFGQVWTGLDKIKLVKTCFNLFDDKLVSIDQNMSYLLKIRKWSQEEEEDQKASPRSAIEDLADKNSSSLRIRQPPYYCEASIENPSRSPQSFNKDPFR